MVYFQTKNPNLGKFRKMLVYFVAMRSIFRTFGIFLEIWDILWSFGIFSPFWYVVPRKVWQPCIQYLMHFAILQRGPFLEQSYARGFCRKIAPPKSQ
jgi:hypothetical protein